VKDPARPENRFAAHQQHSPTKESLGQLYDIAVSVASWSVVESAIATKRRTLARL